MKFAFLEKLYDVYFDAFVKYRRFVIGAWAVVLLFGLIFGGRFVSQTSVNMQAPPGTPSFVSTNVFVEHFPDRATSSSLFFRFHIKEGNVLDGGFVQDATNKLKAAMEGYKNQEVYLGLQGYYTAIAGPNPELADAFVSENKQTTIVGISMAFSITGNTVSVSDAMDFIAFVEEEQEKISDNESFEVGLTGMNVLFRDVVEGAKDDMVHMDSIVLPLAFLVFALYLNSFRLLIIPFFTVLCSIFTSFMFMLPFAMYVWHIAAFAPSVMMSLVVAMSIDYSLFLLTRYREETLAGKENNECVKVVLRSAGKTVVVSGSTLAVTFLGLAFFPLEFLSTIGLCAALALMMTMFVALTLTPAILVEFGWFFNNFTPILSKKRFRAIGRICFPDKFPIEAEDEDAGRDGNALLSGKDKGGRGFWFRSAQFTTTPRNAYWIIAAVIFFSLPICIFVFMMKTTTDDAQVFPRGSHALEVYEDMKEDFSPGQLAPYYIIQTGTVLTTGFYAECMKVMEDVIASVDVPKSGVYSICHVSLQDQEQYIDFETAEMLLADNSSSFGRLYQYAFGLLTSHDGQAALHQLSVAFDPLGAGAEGFVRDLRVTLGKYDKNEDDAKPYPWYLTGGNTQSIDAVDMVYKLFPVNIVVVVTAVFIIVSVNFKSVVVAVRLLFTIALPLCWIYGLASLTFGFGMFNWLVPVLRTVDAIYWLIPVMSFSILVGLGLDYDVFLFARIIEYRRKGFSDRASIIKGVHKTGGIITAAGVVMAIAFAGLMLSSMMALNQFGFVLCIAVLIDTFIVRTAFVPAIAGLLGKWNWWPSKMPDATKDEYDDSDDDDADGARADDGNARIMDDNFGGL